MFHDWMGDAASWEPTILHLDPTGHTYVFADARGYGMSRHLTGAYTADEVASDCPPPGRQPRLDARFHVVGHSMTGLVAQRLAIDDWRSDAKRIKSVVAATRVSADAYPADDNARTFLWNLIGQRDLSEQAFAMLTGQRLLGAWRRLKTNRHLQTSTSEALKGYYRMWLETDFSAEASKAKVATTPCLVIGGRQDVPGFQEDHLRTTFGQCYPNVEFAFVADAGHYPMRETPVYLATPIERSIGQHR